MYAHQYRLLLMVRFGNFEYSHEVSLVMSRLSIEKKTFASEERMYPYKTS